MKYFTAKLATTPTNRAQPRTYDEVTFELDLGGDQQDEPVHVAMKAISELTGVSGLFLSAAIQDEVSSQLKGMSLTCPFSFNFRDKVGERYITIVERVPETRTPATSENILQWATERVERDNPDKNTPELVLARLLLEQAMDCVSDSDRGEFMNLIRDLYWTGTKGYKKYSLRQLLADVKENIVEQFGGVDPCLEDLPYFG